MSRPNSGGVAANFHDAQLENQMSDRLRIGGNLLVTNGSIDCESFISGLSSPLKRLENLGIIEREYQPTDWLSAIVTVQTSNGKLRVCIDPKPLNKALKRTHYSFSVLDDILPCLSKARVFSICDVSSGFWHVELDESSSRLTTFATPFWEFPVEEASFWHLYTT